MKPAVLVTKRIYQEAIDYLREHAEVEYVNSDDSLTADELFQRARGKQAIVSQLVDKFTRDALARLDPSVRVISNVAVGFDNIDLPAATERKILVTNTPGVLTDTTADFAFALLMAAARRVVEGHQFVHSGQWNSWSIDRMCGMDVHHRTLGILGMGRIGKAVAQRGLGFSMRVRYHDTAAVQTDFDAESVTKEQLLRESDFVSVHVPLSDETRHLIGEAELRMMKPTAVFVNTSRGPVVDEAALARALDQKWIAAAGIDVFEREPLVHPDLLKCVNAVLAPHVASASVATRTLMSMMAAQNAVAAIEGRRPPNLLNPELWS